MAKGATRRQQRPRSARVPTRPMARTAPAPTSEGFAVEASYQRRRRITRILGIVQPVAYVGLVVLWINGISRPTLIVFAILFVATLLLRLALTWRWKM